MTEPISEKGFVILKNCIDKNIIETLHQEIFAFFNEGSFGGYSSDDLYNTFLKKTSTNTKSEFDFTSPIFNQLLFKELFDALLKSSVLYGFLTDLLGKDLSFCTDSTMNLNLPDKDCPKKNYLFKDWHQEIWSGASPSTFQMWTPILHKDAKQGQMELIVGSHKWGHVPHRNRSPIDLPEKYDTEILNLEYGDAIIFSTLLMHRSVKATSPRLAVTMLLKNFKHIDNSFQNNRNWKIFSYSEMTKIERILGNHYLSPFRTMR